MKKFWQHQDAPDLTLSPQTASTHAAVSSAISWCDHMPKQETPVFFGSHFNPNAFIPVNFLNPEKSPQLNSSDFFSSPISMLHFAMNYPPVAWATQHFQRHVPLGKTVRWNGSLNSLRFGQQQLIFFRSGKITAINWEIEHLKVSFPHKGGGFSIAILVYWRVKK